MLCHSQLLEVPAPRPAGQGPTQAEREVAFGGAQQRPKLVGLGCAFGIDHDTVKHQGAGRQPSERELDSATGRAVDFDGNVTARVGHPEAVDLNPVGGEVGLNTKFLPPARDIPMGLQHTGPIRMKVGQIGNIDSETATHTVGPLPRTAYARGAPCDPGIGERDVPIFQLAFDVPGQRLIPERSGQTIHQDGGARLSVGQPAGCSPMDGDRSGPLGRVRQQRSGVHVVEHDRHMPRDLR